MPVVIGLIVVMGSVLTGYLMHGGNPMVLLQWSEFIIIGGAGLGSMLIMTGPRQIVVIAKEVVGLVKGNPFDKAAYEELSVMLYDFFRFVRREGELKLEEHVEDPLNSDIFQKYPRFLSNTHAVSFMQDTMKILISGQMDPYDLEAALDNELSTYRKEAMHTSHILQTVGDAMPGYGIVAAVLGVVITMGKIGGDAAEIGHSVGAALVGTFLGVLLAYGVFGPLSQKTAEIAESETQYLRALRAAITAYLKGQNPLAITFYALREVPSHFRPSVSEIQALIREQAKE